MRVEYDWRKMFTRQRILILDALVDGQRVEVRLKEGVNTVLDSTWTAIAARSDVQSMIEGRAIVQLDPLPSGSGGDPIAASLSLTEEDQPKTRTDRELELQSATNQLLSTAARRHGIKKPESGVWKDAIPDILAAEFGSES